MFYLIIAYSVIALVLTAYSISLYLRLRGTDSKLSQLADK
jgi:CcmD family protein